MHADYGSSNINSELLCRLSRPLALETASPIRAVVDGANLFKGGPGCGESIWEDVSEGALAWMVSSVLLASVIFLPNSFTKSE